MENNEILQENGTPDGGAAQGGSGQDHARTDTAPQGERTFTQEEVNRIVQERLARVKAEPSGREADLDRREQEIKERELKMHAREKFREEGLPDFLLDFLDYSGDEGKLDEAMEKMIHGYNSQKHMMANPVPAGYVPAAGGKLPDPDTTAVRKAMGLSETSSGRLDRHLIAIPKRRGMGYAGYDMMKGEGMYGD